MSTDRFASAVRSAVDGPSCPERVAATAPPASSATMATPSRAATPRRGPPSLRARLPAAVAPAARPPDRGGGGGEKDADVGGEAGGDEWYRSRCICRLPSDGTVVPQSSQ